MTPVARGDLASIPLYAPQPLDGVTLDLRDNVSLWGPAPSAVAVVREASGTQLAEYPSVSAADLTATIADQLGVGREHVVAGCGSDDLIDAWLRASGGPGATVAHADPTFSMLATFARLNSLRPVGVALTRDGAMDVDALLGTRAPLIYVCSPNNPTGTVTPRGELLRLFDRAPGVVLLDEAYGEFSDAHDLRREAAARENVLVTRTFSKAWGLAGLRVGYAVGGRALVAAVAKARGPYKVNALAERAAVAALTRDATWLSRVTRESRAARDRLVAGLQGREGVRPWPSEGNFAFVQTTDPAAAVAAQFQARGIGVRAFSGLAGIGEAVRIGSAPWELLSRVADAAAEVWP